MQIAVVFLGGQAFGEKGVDKRMGELSVAITGNLTVFDLPDLEVALLSTVFYYP